MAVYCRYTFVILIEELESSSFFNPDWRNRASKVFDFLLMAITETLVEPFGNRVWSNGFEVDKLIVI
jgi:hypothetical protein